MKRHRHENLLGLRIWVHPTTPDKEVFGAPFYRSTPHTPDRNPAHPVRPSRWPALRRHSHCRTGRERNARGEGLVARRDLYTAADALGLSQPGRQPRWLLPRQRGPRAGLAGLPRRAAVLPQDRPVLQGPPAPARVVAAPTGARDRPGTAPPQPAPMALDGPGRHSRG